MLRNIIIIVIFLFITKGSLADECSEAFKSENYDRAINVCSNDFKKARAYEKLYMCEESIDHFLKSRTRAGLYNAALMRTYGQSGCSVDLEIAEYYIDTALQHKSGVKTHTLSLKGQIINRSKKAETEDSRKLEALSFFIKSLSAKYLEEGGHIASARKVSIDHIKSHIRLNRKTGLAEVLNETEDITYLNEFYSLIFENFHNIDSEDSEQFKSAVRFLDIALKTEHPDAIFYKARMYDKGLGLIENTTEAYRLYLIAAAKGNKRAAKEKNRLKDELSPEQIEKVQCLAKKGLELTFLDELLC